MRRKNQFPEMEVDRPCLRPAIPQIADAARYLDAAVSAHISKNPELAKELIAKANLVEISEWAESLWGKATRYNQSRFVADSPPILKQTQREKQRMPFSELKQHLHSRDGYLRCSPHNGQMTTMDLKGNCSTPAGTSLRPRLHSTMNSLRS